MNVDRGTLAESEHGIAALLPFARKAHDVLVQVRCRFGGKSCEWSERAKDSLDLLRGRSVGL